MQTIITGAVSVGAQSGSLKGALIGGFSARMFHGIGSYFDDVGKVNAGDWAFEGEGAAGSGRALSTAGRVAKTAAHASAGGIMSVLQGGKFGHGFASAGFGEAVSPEVTRWVGDSNAKQFIAGVVIGGTASKLAGGKFANGAQTAAFQWAFNHLTRGNSYQDMARSAAEHVETMMSSLDGLEGAISFFERVHIRLQDLTKSTGFEYRASFGQRDLKSLD